MTCLPTKILVPICILTVFLGVSCIGDPESKTWAEVLDEIRASFPEVRPLSTAELDSWLNDTARESPVLIDARTGREYQVSHLPDALLFEYGSDLARVEGEIPKSTPIVTYCSVGLRSSGTARQLMKLGYESVFNLEGSIFAWANEGRKLVRNGESVDKVHPYNDSWGKLLNKVHHSYGQD